MALPLIIAILCIVFTTICQADSSVLCPANITNGCTEAKCSRAEGDSCAYNCADSCSKRSRGLYLRCRNGTWNTNTDTLCSCKITENVYPGYVIFGIVGTLVLLFCLCGFTGTQCKRRKQMARLRSAAQKPIIQEPRQITQRSTIYGESVTSEAVPIQRVENAVHSRMPTLSYTSQPTNSRSQVHVEQATSLNGWSASQAIPVPRAENEVQSRGPTICNTIASQYTNSCFLGQETTASNGSTYPDGSAYPDALPFNGLAYPDVPHLNGSAYSDGSAYPDALLFNVLAYPDVPHLNRSAYSDGSAYPDALPFNGFAYPDVPHLNGSAYSDPPPRYNSIALSEPEITPPPPSYEDAVSLPVMPYIVNS